MARFSPSRHFVHRRLWVPDRRAEPFFPLNPGPPCWTISPGAAAGLPPARVAESVPNDIIPAQLPRCGLSPLANCSGSYLTVPSVEPSGTASLQHPHLHPQCRSVDGNDWARCAMNPRAIALYTASLEQSSASFPVSRPLAIHSNSPRHTDSKVHEPGPRYSGPTYAGRTTDPCRDRWHE